MTKDARDLFHAVRAAYAKSPTRLKVSRPGVWLLGLGFSVHLSAPGSVMMMMRKLLGALGCLHEILLRSLGCHMHSVDLGFPFAGSVRVGLPALKVKE